MRLIAWGASGSVESASKIVQLRLERLVPSWQERVSVRAAVGSTVSQVALTVSYAHWIGIAWRRPGLVSAESSRVA